MNRLGHVPALNGVRGLAILAVLGLHFFGLPGGFYGVDVFFVLSGFLITTLLLEEHDRAGAVSMRGFYVRRARRLLPALVALLVYVTLVGAYVYSTGRLVELVSSVLFYVANFAGAFAHPAIIQGTPVGHLWSLSEEEQFYLLWPLVLIFALRRVRESRLLVYALGLFAALVVYRVALVAGGFNMARIYYGPDTHADGLVIGCAAAFARRQNIRLRSGYGFAGLAVLTVALIAGRLETPAWTAFGLPIVELAAATMVLAAAQPGLFARMLSVRPLPWLGVISYSLYLWHQFARWMTGWTHPWPALLLTIVLSLGSYYLVERRFRYRRPKTLVVDPAPAVMVQP